MLFFGTFSCTNNALVLFLRMLVGSCLRVRSDSRTLLQSLTNSSPVCLLLRSRLWYVVSLCNNCLGVAMCLLSLLMLFFGTFSCTNNALVLFLRMLVGSCLRVRSDSRTLLQSLTNSSPVCLLLRSRLWYVVSLCNNCLGVATCLLSLLMLFFGTFSCTYNALVLFLRMLVGSCLRVRSDSRTLLQSPTNSSPVCLLLRSRLWYVVSLCNNCLLVGK
jgi:hypothetical protein